MLPSGQGRHGEDRPSDQIPGSLRGVRTTREAGDVQASVRPETDAWVTRFHRRALRQRGRRKAERDSEGELPVGGSAREAPPDTRVEPHVLRGPGLPDDTEERGIALVLAARFLSVDLGDEADSVGNGKLTDHSPDPDEITGRPLDTEPTVHVEHEGAELVGHDANGFEPELPFSLFGGGQKRPGFDR